MRAFFLLLFLALFLPLSATPENPLIPDTWFQEITATDGSTQQCVIFTTIPGVEYTFYHSDALETWTEIGKTYGLGQQFSAAMRETAPAPPPPDPQNPPAPAPERSNASITIQASAAVEGGTVISWPSLDHGNAVQYLITGNMATDWDTVPMFVEAYGTHQFFISHPTGTTAPPATNPILETKDAAMIADLEAAWSTFNTSVANAATIARNTPPPPPPAPDSKGFWRIKADWSLDSDGDGSLDHAEFALAAEGADANGLVGNPFNADTDGNGIPDGNQLDKDKDGTPDAEDVDPNDDLIAYKKVSLPRYAMFEFSDTLPMPTNPWVKSNSLAINDRGTVLFPDRVWKGGDFQSLVTRTAPDLFEVELDEDHDVFARAINDKDQIIGGGSSQILYDYTEDRDPVLIHYWPDLDATPVQVTAEIPGEITIYAETPPDTYDKYVSHLDNEGRFFTQTFTWIPTGGGSDAYTQGGWREWTLPEENTPMSFKGATDFSKGFAPGGIIWGSQYDASSGAFSSSSITAPFSLDIPLYDTTNVLGQLDTGLLVAAGSHSYHDAYVRKGAGWRISELLAPVVDISDNGTAIGKRSEDGAEPGEILLNGKWTAMEHAVPGIPQNWLTNPNVKLVDTTANGWILAQDRGHPLPADNKAAALLPLRFKGLGTDNNPVSDSAGVDDFSIGSSDPDLIVSNYFEGVTAPLPIQDRIWIMAPQGGAPNTVVLESPLSPGASLKINSPGILFGGQEDATRSSTGTTLHVTAAPWVTSGTESIANLWISDGTYDTPAVSKPVGFKVMKARTVKVLVYQVAHTFNKYEYPGAPPQLVTQLPVNMPSEQEIEDHLNEIYLPQTNVTFDVKVRPTPIVVDWDAPTAGVSPAPARDERLKVGTNALDELSSEQGKIIAAIPPDEPSQNIRMFFVGTAQPFLGKEVRTLKGYTSRQDRMVWIWSKPLPITVPGATTNDPPTFVPDPLVTEDNLITAGHEPGHVMIGPGHPDEGAGAAPLPGLKATNRVMVSGESGLGSLNSKLLTKTEWNWTDKWLKKEEDEGRLEN